MKRLLSRKAFLRVLRIAAFAFLCWVGGQRSAQAQVFTAPFTGSGTTYGATSTTPYSGAYGFYGTGTGYTFTIGSGVSVTNTSSSGYGSASGANFASPYATVTLGGGTISNSGLLALNTTQATNNKYLTALALGQGGDVAMDNAGTLESTVGGSFNVGTLNSSIAALSFSGAHSLNFTNEGAGTISSSVTVSNSTASGRDANVNGYGLYAYATGAGTLSIANYGAISNVSDSSSYNQTLQAYGLSATSGSGAITIYNKAGTISGSGTSSSTYSSYVYGYGIFASSTSGAVTVINAATALGVANASVVTIFEAYSWGIYASSDSNAVTIDNSGTAQANSTCNSYGIGAQTTSGAITIDNSGHATASAYVINTDYTGGTVSGIYAASSGSGSIAISNTGTASATSTQAGSDSAYGQSYGIYAHSTGSGAISIVNQGTVTSQYTSMATASGGTSTASSYGLYALSTGSSGITITNAGSVSAAATAQSITSGEAVGYGIYASSASGNVSIANQGTLVARSTASGDTSSTTTYGIYASSGLNTRSSLYVQNSGSITSTGETSYGIYLAHIGTVVDSGTIRATTNGTTPATAISVLSGSLVVLEGAAPDIVGKIVGGANAQSTSQIEFKLTLYGNYASQQASLNAQIATYDQLVAAAGTGANAEQVFTIDGQTYDVENFEGAVDQVVQGRVYAQTPGYASLGTALDNLRSSSNANGQTLLASLDALPASSVSGALTQLSPAAVSRQFSSEIQNDAVYQNLRVDNRLAQVRQNFAGGFDANGFQVASADDPLLQQIKGQLYAYNPSEPAQTMGDTPDKLDEKNPVSAAEQMNRWGTFLSGNAVIASQGATSSSSGIESTTVDVTAGADYRLNQNWTVGFLAGYGHSTATVDDYGSQVTNDQYRFGPYVGYSDGPWYANGDAHFAFDDENSQRVIPFLGQTAQASPDGTQYGVNADGGYDFRHDNWTYGPTAGLQYTHFDLPSYAESGSVADLTVNAQHIDSLISSLGGRVAYNAHWKWDNSTLIVETHASWLHEYMNQDQGVGAAFDVPGSTAFTTEAPGEAVSDWALTGASIQNVFAGGSLLFVSYDARVGLDGASYLAESITGGLRIPF